MDPLIKQFFLWGSQLNQENTHDEVKHSDLRMEHPGLALLLKEFKDLNNIKNCFLLGGTLDLATILPRIDLSNSGDTAFLVLRPYIHCELIFLKNLEGKIHCFWLDPQNWGWRYYPNRETIRLIGENFPQLEFFDLDIEIQSQSNNVDCDTYVMHWLKKIYERQETFFNEIKDCKIRKGKYSNYREIRSIVDLPENFAMTENETEEYKQKIKIKLENVILKNYVILNSKNEEELNFFKIETVILEMMGYDLLPQNKLFSEPTTFFKFNDGSYTINIEKNIDNFDISIRFSNKDIFNYNNLIRFTSALYPKDANSENSEYLLGEPTSIAQEYNKFEIHYKINDLTKFIKDIENIKKTPFFYFKKNLRQLTALTQFLLELRIAIELVERKDHQRGGFFSNDMIDYVRSIIEKPEEIAVIDTFSENNLIEVNLTKKIILVPWQKKEEHAILFVVNVAEKTITCFDPEQNDLNINDYKFISNFIKNNNFSIKKSQYTFPKQTDNWSCILHVIQYIKIFILQQNTTSSIKDIAANFCGFIYLKAYVSANNNIYDQQIDSLPPEIKTALISVFGRAINLALENKNKDKSDTLMINFFNILEEGFLSKTSFNDKFSLSKEQQRISYYLFCRLIFKEQKFFKENTQIKLKENNKTFLKLKNNVFERRKKVMRAALPDFFKNNDEKLQVFSGELYDIYFELNEIIDFLKLLLINCGENELIIHKKLLDFIYKFSIDEWKIIKLAYDDTRDRCKTIYLSILAAFYIYSMENTFFSLIDIIGLVNSSLKLTVPDDLVEEIEKNNLNRLNLDLNLEILEFKKYQLNENIKALIYYANFPQKLIIKLFEVNSLKIIVSDVNYKYLFSKNIIKCLIEEIENINSLSEVLNFLSDDLFVANLRNTKSFPGKIDKDFLFNNKGTLKELGKFINSRENDKKCLNDFKNSLAFIKKLNPSSLELMGRILIYLFYNEKITSNARNSFLKVCDRFKDADLGFWYDLIQSTSVILENECELLFDFLGNVKNIEFGVTVVNNKIISYKLIIDFFKKTALETYPSYLKKLIEKYDLINDDSYKKHIGEFTTDLNRFYQCWVFCQEYFKENNLPFHNKAIALLCCDDPRFILEKILNFTEKDTLEKWLEPYIINALSFYQKEYLNEIIKNFNLIIKEFGEINPKICEAVCRIEKHHFYVFFKLTIALLRNNCVISDNAYLKLESADKFLGNLNAIIGVAPNQEFISKMKSYFNILSAKDWVRFEFFIGEAFNFLKVYPISACIYLAKIIDYSPNFVSHISIYKGVLSKLKINNLPITNNCLKLIELMFKNDKLLEEKIDFLIKILLAKPSDQLLSELKIKLEESFSSFVNHAKDSLKKSQNTSAFFKGNQVFCNKNQETFRKTGLYDYLNDQKNFDVSSIRIGLLSNEEKYDDLFSIIEEIKNEKEAVSDLFKDLLKGCSNNTEENVIDFNGVVQKKSGDSSFVIYLADPNKIKNNKDIETIKEEIDNFLRYTENCALIFVFVKLKENVKTNDCRGDFVDFTESQGGVFFEINDDLIGSFQEIFAASIIMAMQKKNEKNNKLFYNIREIAQNYYKNSPERLQDTNNNNQMLEISTTC